MISVPRSWSDLTPAWMTAALAGRCPRAVVDEVELAEIVQGTNSRAVARLRYGQGTGPPRVFVKAQGRMLHRLALIALRALAAEARLLDSGARLPIECPLGYAAGVDRRRLATIVVMEDVTGRGGAPNDATRALSVAEVRSGLRELARLHAAHWARPLPPGLGFLAPWRLGRGWAPLSAANLARGVRRLRAGGRERLVPASASVRLLERQFRASAALAAGGPQTVLHGDPHPGNTYALPGARTGFYDWQLVRRGSWSHDVGYFVVSSLDVADRRSHERELLDEYLEALGQAGAAPPTREAAWSRHRAAPAFGLGTWLHTYAAGSFQPDAVCLATLERFAAAYEDLGTARSGALGHLTG